MTNDEFLDDWDSDWERDGSVSGDSDVAVAARTAQKSIEVQNLNKVRGERPVVRDLSFHVDPGEVYALVGPNGAGKTTVIRLLTGLIFPTSGTVKLLGQDPLSAPEVRRKLGAVVEAPAAFYPYLTGRANLHLHAQLAGGVEAGRIGEVLDIVELGNAAERKVGAYSLGMRQRLGVAAAILTRPEVLILDEPASGMDPLSLHLVHRVLRGAAEGGAAVLLSTHHLDEVVAYCSRVAILEEGALVEEVDLGERRQRYKVRVSNAAGAKVALQTQAFIGEVGGGEGEVTFTLSDEGALGRVPSVLVNAGVEVLELTKDTFNLQAHYAERVARKQAAARETKGSAAQARPTLGRGAGGSAKEAA